MIFCDLPLFLFYCNHASHFIFVYLFLYYETSHLPLTTTLSLVICTVSALNIYAENILAQVSWPMCEVLSFSCVCWSRITKLQGQCSAVQGVKLFSKSNHAISELSGLWVLICIVTWGTVRYWRGNTYPVRECQHPQLSASRPEGGSEASTLELLLCDFPAVTEGTLKCESKWTLLP